MGWGGGGKKRQNEREGLSEMRVGRLEEKDHKRTVPNNYLALKERVIGVVHHCAVLSHRAASGVVIALKGYMMEY